MFEMSGQENIQQITLKCLDYDHTYLYYNGGWWFCMTNQSCGSYWCYNEHVNPYRLDARTCKCTTVTVNRKYDRKVHQLECQH